MFKSSYLADVSLDQWMALTPPGLVEAHLKRDRQVMAALRKNKTPVVPAQNRKHREENRYDSCQFCALVLRINRNLVS